VVKAHRVNGIRVEDLVGTGLVVKERYVLPLWLTVPPYLLGKTLVGLTALVRWLVKAWRVSVPAGLLLVLRARYGTAGPVVLGLVVLVVGGVWWSRWPGSFARLVTRRAYGTWRRWWVYRRRWASVMDGAALSRTTPTAVYVPQITAVSSTRVVDTIHLRLLHGQTPADVGFAAEGLRHAFEAHRCVVNETRPGRVSLRFYARDPLTRVVPALPVAVDPTAVDLDALPVGLAETGQTYRLRLAGTHVLIVGSTGAGKGSAQWSILRALTPAIHAGWVVVTGVDPKGGMELYPGRPLFRYYADDTPAAQIEALEAAVERMTARRDRLRAAGRRRHVPSVEDPFEVVLVDELAFLTAYLPDKGLRIRFGNALSLLLTQGRAVGFAVVASLQDPRKEVLSVRNLFPTRIGLRLAEESETSMVLGEEALDAGGACHLIPQTLPGVGYVHLDGVAEPVRVRFGWVNDDDITAMSTTPTPTPAPEPGSDGPPDPGDRPRPDQQLEPTAPSNDERPSGDQSRARRSA
jgi:DNA segregation ATPase FtsK/SpoIIIE, S-DNA-T family